MKLPAALKPETIIALVDSREKQPLDLSPLRSEVATLSTGDYSVRGLEHLVAVERKSLSDLLGCVGQHRDRFERELDRLRAYPSRLLLIEASWGDIEAGQWQNRITSSQVTGSLLAWIEGGTPILMAGNHERAGRFAAKFLFTCARRRWREVRDFAAAAMTNSYAITNER